MILTSVSMRYTNLSFMIVIISQLGTLNDDYPTCYRKPYH